MDLLAADKDGGLTPLHEAVEANNAEIVEIILEHVVRSRRSPNVSELISRRCKSGKTPRDLATTAEITALIENFSARDVGVCKVENTPGGVALQFSPLVEVLLPMILAKYESLPGVQKR